MKIKASIIGATGYTGFELIRILSNHPNCEISYITSRKSENISVQDLYPTFFSRKNIKFENIDIEKIAKNSDVIFTALPHKASMKIVKDFLSYSKRVIDLSADFRFSDIRLYEKWYCKHEETDIAAKAVYGLPEIFRDKIKQAELIANPGCYPTSAVLGLYPLLRKKININKNIIVDSKSGVTGAGRNPSIKTIFTEVNDNFSAYGIGSHRHEPEIEEKLTNIYGKELNVTFTPHLLPINRGILSTIYVSINDKINENEIRKIYNSTYGNEYFVKVLPENILPTTAMVKASNYCFIGLKYIEAKKQLIVVSVIDNIVKGASGQAIQNMNIMFDLPENQSLTSLPTYL
jgi:N-acetyl-gamma-glutamyl-phosphate reductase